MRLYFALVSLALVIAALAGAALSWDGSYFLYKTLDARSSFAPHGRYQDIVLHLPALWVSTVTSNLAVIRAVYGLSHIVIPLGSLLACWLIVRKRAPGLFVWPAIGIGLILLPGVFSLTSEGIQVVEFFWPVLLAIMVGVSRPMLVVTIIFAVATYVAHPTGSALLGFAALTALLCGLRDRQRRYLVSLAGVLLVLGVVRFAEVHGNAYEASALNVASEVGAFQASVAGFPLLAIAATYVACAAIFLVPRLRQDEEAPIRLSVMAYALGGITVAGLILVYWAHSPSLWAGELLYKGWALFCSGPVLCIAVLDALVTSKAPARSESLFRGRITLGTAIVFLLVLTVQSLGFVGLSNRLTTALAKSPSPCVSASSLSYVKHTPFDHWSLSSYALLQGSRSPRTVVLQDPWCQRARATGKVQLISFDGGTIGVGWFNFGLVDKRLPPAGSASSELTALAADQSHACEVTTLHGWYSLEQSPKGSWHWSAGSAALSIYAERPLTVELHADMVAARGADRVAIKLNGQTRATVQVRAGGWQPLPTIQLALRQGGNTLEFEGHNPAVRVKGDSRLLALAVRNVVFMVGGGPSVCASPDNVTIAPMVSYPMAVKAPNRGCTYALQGGWYGIEERSGSWRRWTAGTGTVLVRTMRTLGAYLITDIASLKPGNAVDVVVDGKKQTTIRLWLDGFEAVAPVPLHLPAGTHTIRFVSHAPASHIATDRRALAIAVADMRITNGFGASQCALRASVS